MAIPKYFEFFPPIMEVLSDGKIHHFKEVRDYCVKYYSLTDEEQQEMLPSGNRSYVNDRVGWAKTYLKKAGLLLVQHALIIRLQNSEKMLLKKA